ncbi:hypothetical protein SAMN03159488_04408 [Pseudomonas sp. NFIX10]|nr:hypothetical protein SAMN03159488_04408 [Pseudomonas sp. NFIX10]SFF25594.1 hypothetical protein SAMN03159367_03685 [Pseudomonas sp. NFACC06-1]
MQVPAEISIACQGLIASKLAPTGDIGAYAIPVGAELARDSGLKAHTKAGSTLYG